MMLALATLFLLSQNPQQDFRPVAAEGHVMRLQVSRPGHTSCLLVHADASYRFEERALQRVTVRAGALTPEELSDLRMLLDNPPLSALDPRSIPLPVVRDAIRDTLVLAIARDAGWKNLHFGDEASRRPVQVQLEWLLELLRKTKERKAGSLPEKAANNCVPSTPAKAPPVEPASKAVPDAEAPPAAALTESAQAPNIERPPFLVLIRNLRLHDSARRQCLLVRPDGAFRFEKTSQTPGQEMKGQVMFGRLAAEELVELETLLQGLDVQNASAKPTEADSMFREGEMTSAYFFKDGQPRWLRAGSYFGLSGSRNQIVGDRKSLEPFTKWLSRIDKKRLTPTTGATLDDCRVQ